MKEQYVGDVGDFGKVLILKHLASLGFRLGVHWVLTRNDGGGDGAHRKYSCYLGNDCLCCCDEDVFRDIRPLTQRRLSERKIGDLENLIRRFAADAVFFGANCDERKLRVQREQDALALLNPSVVDLVFFDPDNGISRKPRPSKKHVSCDDMKRYWDRGQSLLIYHHMNFAVHHTTQIVDMSNMLANAFSNATLEHYYLKRGTGRVYFLCIQPGHLELIRGKETVPAIEPLEMTKEKWAAKQHFCTKHQRRCSN